MTTKHAHICNLCGGKIADNNAGKGIEFGTGHVIQVRYLMETENHLCNDCLVSLKRLLDKGLMTEDIRSRASAQSATIS